MQSDAREPNEPEAGCLVRGLAPAVWIFLILVGSLIPGGPPMPGSLAFPDADLVLHLGGYAILAGLIDWALMGEPGSARGCLAVVFPFWVGAVLELLQPLVGRTMSWRDVGANTVGLVAGFVLAEIVLQHLLKD